MHVKFQNIQCLNSLGKNRKMYENMPSSLNVQPFTTVYNSAIFEMPWVFFILYASMKFICSSGYQNEMANEKLPSRMIFYDTKPMIDLRHLPSRGSPSAQPPRVRLGGRGLSATPVLCAKRTWQKYGSSDKEGLGKRWVYLRAHISRGGDMILIARALQIRDGGT